MWFFMVQKRCWRNWVCQENPIRPYAAFGQYLVKPGLMDKKYHDGGLRLFYSRIDSDYLPKPADTFENAQQALSFAETFLAACRTFLETRAADPNPG